MKPKRLRRLFCGLSYVLTAITASAIQAAYSQSLDWQRVSQDDRSALTFAIPMGTEEKLPLYACRAEAGAGVHPGRFRNDFTGCHIGFGGREISVMPFEILTSAWRDDGGGSVPPDSFVGGQRVSIGPQSSFNLIPLYPCRASYQGTLQVGEVAAGDKGCTFGFGGRQVAEQQYQVLWAAPWLTWSAGIVHQIERDAVLAGSEGAETFYVCRAADQAGLHTGKVKQDGPGCSISSAGKETVTTRFSVLAVRWLPGHAGTIPAAALPVGSDGESLLFLCRAQIRDTVQIGKIDEELASCHVGMMESEVTNQSYDILSAQ
jgi:hypothetical protein